MIPHHLNSLSSQWTTYPERIIQRVSLYFIKGELPHAVCTVISVSKLLDFCRVFFFQTTRVTRVPW